MDVDAIKKSTTRTSLLAACIGAGVLVSNVVWSNFTVSTFGVCAYILILSAYFLGNLLNNVTQKGVEGIKK